MTTHSKMIGGSTAKRVIHCPGSWRLSKTLPTPHSSSYADEGTLCHNAMAMILDEEVNDPRDVIGLTYGEHELTEELYDELIQPALAQFYAIPWKDYIVEQQVSFPKMPGEFGTADVIGYTKNETIVLDWKFGRGVYVSPYGNEQLRYYGSAARYSVPQWFDHRPVRLYIVQPAFPSNQPYDTVSVAELEAFERKLLQTTRVMKKPDAPVQPGDWCKFCPAKAICPALLQAATAALEQDGPLPPDELGAWVLDVAPRLEELIAERRKTAREQLDAGHRVPGLKLIAGRKTRSWQDENEAEKYFRRKRIRVGDMTVRKLKSVAQMEKVTDVPSDLVEIKTGRSMVSEDDPRPALANIPAGLIKAIGDRR